MDKETQSEKQQESQVSASWQRTIDRATQRGDWDRVAQMYAIPSEQRKDWKPKGAR